jgi:uncharacterized protein YcfL
MSYRNLLILSMLLLAAMGCMSESGVANSPESEQIQESELAQVAELPVEQSELSQVAVEVVKSGDFASGEHPTQGTVQIIQQDNQTLVEFGETFQTSQGPDLFVILHRSPDVIGSTTPPDYPIAEGDYVLLAPLAATSGTQRYAVPGEVNLSDYASVAIWCRQFNATFGAAALQ